MQDIYYSATAGGFLTADIHGLHLPDDAIEQADWTSTYTELLDGQAAGKEIVADAQGFPVLRSPPQRPLTTEQVMMQRRFAYVQETDPLKNEADYNALITGEPPDYTVWVEKVGEIRARYPFPE